MLISKEMEEALNRQVGHELAASLQYLNIGAYFDGANLRKLAELFYHQVDEEKEHALKLAAYVVKTGGELRVPAVPQPKHGFASAEEAVKLALDLEMEVARQYHDLMELAGRQKDHASHDFLTSFVREQVEEIADMQRLLDVVRMAGKSLLVVEAYLVHG